MKTLVLHPDDRSTDFQRQAYANLDAEVITDFSTLTKADLLRKVAEADRVLCLGHGFPQGLMNTNMRTNRSNPLGINLVVDDDFAVHFQRQPNNVYWWCNADVYMARHGLSGWASGMWVSELREAWIFNVDSSASEIEDSNRLASGLLNEALVSGLSIPAMNHHVLSGYRGESAVMAYNRSRMFAFDRGRHVADIHLQAA